MIKDTIIFLNIYPTSKIILEAFDINLLIRSGFRVIYLDMSAMHYSKTYNKCQPSKTGYFADEAYFLERNAKFIKCSTREDVAKWIKEYSDRAWFYPLFSRLNETMDKMWLKRSFKKYKCDYILQVFYSLPAPTGISTIGGNLKNHFISVFLRDLKSFNIGDIVKKSCGWLSFFLMTRNIYYKCPTYCFVCGNLLRERFKSLYARSEIIDIPSYEYYRYFRAVSNERNSRSPQIPTYDYLLYYDQSIFDSPDGKLLGIPANDKAVFFRDINRFFDRIEKVTGKRVVIAASPKCKYKGDEYNSREIIYDLTPELTYYSDLVIMHNTTALCFAVAMHKPIAVLSMQGLNKLAKEAIESMAFALRKKLLDASENLDNASLYEASKVDNEFYSELVYNYMSVRPFDESPSQILVNTLKKQGVTHGC